MFRWVDFPFSEESLTRYQMPGLAVGRILYQLRATREAQVKEDEL